MSTMLHVDARVGGAARRALRWSILAGAAALLVAVALIGIGAYRARHLVDFYWQSHRARTDVGQIPTAWLNDLLAVADPAFYRHHGVDLWTPGAGFTTITQALAKALYFRDFRPGWRKIPQTMFAIGFALRVSKGKQLAPFVDGVYLGTARDGSKIHGLADAAREDFARPLSALERPEIRALVVAIVSANALDPRLHPQETAERVRRIDRLLAHECSPSGLSDVLYEGCGQ